MAEAALFSIFMKVLSWCHTTLFGFKPSFFLIQGWTGLVSVSMASLSHSGCWAGQSTDAEQWWYGEVRLGKGVLTEGKVADSNLKDITIG